MEEGSIIALQSVYKLSVKIRRKCVFMCMYFKEEFER